MRRMTNIEELRADSPYHVLDMFRWPTHLYRPAIDICKFLTREVGVFSGQVGMKKRFDGKEAVAEVVLHYPNYEKDDDGEPELITEEEEQELEVMVCVMRALHTRFQISIHCLFGCYRMNCVVMDSISEIRSEV